MAGSHYHVGLPRRVLDAVEKRLRWTIRGARRRKVVCRLTLTTAPGEWRLEPIDGRLPAGWVIAVMRGPAPVGGVLRIDSAQDGGREVGVNTDRGVLLRLPDHVRSLEFSADDGGGVEFEFCEVSRPEALTRAFWSKRRSLGKLFRDIARLGLRPALGAFSAEFRPAASGDYKRWTKLYNMPRQEELTRLSVSFGPEAPTISVITPIYQTPSLYLRRMIQSVRAQAYPRFELVMADDASPDAEVRAILQAEAEADPRIKLILREQNGHISAATNSALTAANGDFVAFLDHDDMLAPHCLATMAQAIKKNSTTEILYSDEDRIDADDVHRDPFLKPDWSHERLLAQNYVNHLTMMRADLVRRIGGLRVGFEGSQDHDLLLRAAAATKGPIVHVPHVLYHWRQFEGGETFSNTQLSKAMTVARRAVEEHLASQGVTAKVVDHDIGIYRVKRAPPARWPSVSVIIPTRDCADVLRKAIDGLLKTTDYEALDVIIADNESSQPESVAYLREIVKVPNVRVVPAAGPFNFSRINNIAAAEARGEILLLLNNDISMIEPGWLKEMVSYAILNDVGAVGARLLYPDTTLQHGGMVMGIARFAGHAHKGAMRSDPGYFGRLRMPQEVGGVTAACLAIRRAVYEEIGGLDEINVAVGGNDIDLCLRLREAGYRIIWTPYAELFHWESKSRGHDDTGPKLERLRREIEYLRTRWGNDLLVDPYWNPNLSINAESPTLAFPPRTPRPWD